MTERPAEEERAPDSLTPGTVQRRWRARRIALLLVLACVLVIGGWVGWYLVRIGRAANEALHEIFVTPAPRPAVGATVTVRPSVAPTTIRLATPSPTPTELPRWEGNEPLTVLLIGVDTTPERAGEGALPLADAIVLARADPVVQKAVLLSIPRDLLVEIPGVGWDRINAAYAYGEANGTSGPALLMATIEQNFGVHVDAFAQVDFAGFVRVIDLLGGVVIDIPAPIKDDEFPGPAFTYQRVYFSPGLQRLDGERALAYVRTRHDDNDLARGLRQQQVLRALRAQAIRVDALRRAPELLTALGNAIRTDLAPRQALALARLGLELSPDAIESASLAGFVSDATLPSGAAVLVGNWPAIRSEVARLFGTTGSPESEPGAVGLGGPEQLPAGAARWPGRRRRDATSRMSGLARGWCRERHSRLPGRGDTDTRRGADAGRASHPTGRVPDTDGRADGNTGRANGGVDSDCPAGSGAARLAVLSAGRASRCRASPDRPDAAGREGGARSAPGGPDLTRSGVGFRDRDSSRYAASRSRDR